MLAKDPEQRWHSCGELLRELYRIQVEYCPQASPEELASWDSVGMEPLSDPRMRAKRQLAEAMRNAPREANRLGRWALAAGMVLSLVAAGGAAWFTMRPPLLTPPQHSEKAGIPREDSEWQQWFSASRYGTVDAWKSVIEYPGVSELVAARAKQQLVRIYLLRERNFDRAIEVCKELADSSDKEFKAFGLAGMAVALSQKTEYNQSEEVLKEYAPLQQDLLDTQMEEMVRKTIDRNREKLGPPSRLESGELMKEMFSPSG